VLFGDGTIATVLLPKNQTLLTKCVTARINMRVFTSGEANDAGGDVDCELHIC